MREEYDLVLKNIPLYSKRKRLVAEIDVMACKGEHCDVYEVKCSHRITKARQQLKKIKRLLSKRVDNTFFFCGESGMIMAV